MSVPATFLLTNPDFFKMTVVKAYARTVVAPAIDYWRTTIDTKKGAEVARLKVARIFNPLHVLGYQISVADIDSLKILRLTRTEHPLIMPHIDGMKSEIIKYQALVKSIKPPSLDQRKDAKGKDTFVLSDWWRCNSGAVPSPLFAFVCVQSHTQQGAAWAVGTHRRVVKSGGMVVLIPSAQVVVMSDM